MSWRSKAVCFNDSNSDYWLSYNFEKIQYAKRGCSKCPVQEECLMSVLEEEHVVGVVAGFSEFDRLVMINKDRGV